MAGKAPAIWDRRDAAHVRWFGLEVLGPFIASSRDRSFMSGEAVTTAAQMWILALADVPQDVLVAAVEQLVRTGITWMPRPGDLRAACQAVVAERRRLLGARRLELLDACTCGGPEPGWELVADTEGPLPRLTRCKCWRAGKALMDQAPATIELPPAPAEDAA